MKSFEEELKELMDLSEVSFEVDPDDLDEEIVAVPADFAFLVEKYNRIVEMCMRSESSLKRVKAAEYLRIVEGSSKKPTKDHIEAMVALNSKVIEVTDICDALKSAKEAFKNHLDSMRLRDHAVSRLVNSRLAERKSC